MFELTAAPDDDRRFKLCDKEVVVMQVIRTTLTRRGNGRDTALRAITQYWSMDGELLAEKDPCPDVIAVADQAAKNLREKLKQRDPCDDESPSG